MTVRAQDTNRCCSSDQHKKKVCPQNSVKIESSTFEKMFHLEAVSKSHWEFDITPSGRTQSKTYCMRVEWLSLPVVHASSWTVRGFHGLSVNLLCLPWVLSFLVFPSMFVFVHVRLDQIAHLHWVDLPALAVAHLMTRNTRYLHINSQEKLIQLMTWDTANWVWGFKLLVGETFRYLGKGFNPPSRRLCVESLCIHPCWCLSSGRKAW